ncbi:MAG TPA: sucrose phosphorylase [Burkholderiaceae bacterium]|nr:sucrose phosphorylase [Burkholderiaceae bacterium]
MKNQVQLIAYVDRFGGGALGDLRDLLRGPLAGVFGGVHLLPFFHPIDGADAGFDPIDHERVDPRLGDWTDIATLSNDVDVVADLIVNHVSAESPQFRDFRSAGSASPHAGMFLTLGKVFAAGATEEQLLAIYRPRPGLPFTTAIVGDGERRILWTTFTPQQIDIDVESPQGTAYLDGILGRFQSAGVRTIRLDAVGYAIKRAGTSCFMIPETYDFIDDLVRRARWRGMQVLVEIHAHYRQQIQIARRVDWVYDFALPPLLLHAFHGRRARHLAHWLEVRPRNAVTVLDTHDGIGMIDIGADTRDGGSEAGLVPPDELAALVDRIHDASRGESRAATGAAASNLDLYQVNCTYLDALGGNERAYLAARALQLFVPGVPQVYYVGFLAGRNDMQLLAKTGVGRDINRPYYRREDVAAALKQTLVRDQIELFRMRNTHPAFDGQFGIERVTDDAIVLLWRNGAHHARLGVDFAAGDFAIDVS